MSFSEVRSACKLTIINGTNGAKYQVERLPRSPGEYAKGFRLALLGWEPTRPVCHTHQLSDGRHECSCTFWAKNRECEHTKLLTAAGLLDEPVNPDDLCREDEWDPDEIIGIADAL